MTNLTLRKNLDGNLISLEKYLTAMEFDDDEAGDDDDFDQDEDDALSEDAWEARREREREDR